MSGMISQEPHTPDFYQIVVHVAFGRGSVFLRQGDKIPRGKGKRSNFGVFFLVDNALYSNDRHKKTAEPIEMPFGMMSGLGPRNSCVTRGDDPRRG